MKSKVITRITPYLFEEHLIIPLDKKWLDVFKKIPTFDVRMDNRGRLVITSPSIIKSGD